MLQYNAATGGTETVYPDNKKTISWNDFAKCTSICKTLRLLPKW